jgi:hypothetical protein
VPVYTCIKYEHGSPCDVKTHGAASLAVCTAQIPGFPSSALKEGRRKKTACTGFLPTTVIYSRIPLLYSIYIFILEKLRYKISPTYFLPEAKVLKKLSLAGLAKLSRLRYS